MAARVEEAYSERDQTVNAKGEVTEIEIPYLVFGAEDEDAALSAARSKAASHSISGMVLDSLEVTERINDDTWKVKAIYEAEDGETPDNPDTDDETSSFAFDTGGGTMHRNQSLKTVAKVPNDAPDFNGAIEVDNEGNVNGVDVTMPVGGGSLPWGVRPEAVEEGVSAVGDNLPLRGLAQPVEPVGRQAEGLEQERMGLPLGSVRRQGLRQQEERHQGTGRGLRRAGVPGGRLRKPRHRELKQAEHSSAINAERRRLWRK